MEIHPAFNMNLLCRIYLNVVSMWELLDVGHTSRCILYNCNYLFINEVIFFKSVLCGEIKL